MTEDALNKPTLPENPKEKVSIKHLVGFESVTVDMSIVVTETTNGEHSSHSRTFSGNVKSIGPVQKEVAAFNRTHENTFRTAVIVLDGTGEEKEVRLYIDYDGSSFIRHMVASKIWVREPKKQEATSCVVGDVRKNDTVMIDEYAWAKQSGADKVLHESTTGVITKIEKGVVLRGGQRGTRLTIRVAGSRAPKTVFIYDNQNIHGICDQIIYRFD